MIFQVDYFPPGTPYPDEPSELIPAGYYVTGGDADGDAIIALHVHHADDGAAVVTAEVAGIVARALNQSRFGPGGGEQG